MRDTHRVLRGSTAAVNPKLKKTIPYRFSDKHLDYIRKCQGCMYNIAEGAVRAGKTVDNVYAFAHELKTHPDKIHLATGSTGSNAKLNIGDANGFGLEYIFRGQCHWGKYKGNECLIINGPATKYRDRIVIFAGAALASSFKKIRGNSYGMWIATEINLHHDNTIKEAFNRTAASNLRKVFWDLNPDHPKAKIYTDYIDLYRDKEAKGELVGGYNYQHFTIHDNINVSEQRRKELESQYDVNSIWYARDILGIRSIAEGLCYPAFASFVATGNNPCRIKRSQLRLKNERLNPGETKLEIGAITIAIDFGGSGSRHAFVASAPLKRYAGLVALVSELHDANVDPFELGRLYVKFVKRVLDTYGQIVNSYADSAEQVLIRGLGTSLAQERLGRYAPDNAFKETVNDRIFCLSSLIAQGRFFYTEDCQSLEDAISMAVWKEDQTKMERLDDGTSDIDTMDAFEYSFERDIDNYIDRRARTNGPA